MEGFCVQNANPGCGLVMGHLQARNVQGNGAPGITIGDWLVDQGLDAPKAPRIRSVGAMRGGQRHTMAVRQAAASSAARSSAVATAAPTGGGGGGGNKQVGVQAGNHMHKHSLPELSRREVTVVRGKID